MQSVIIGSLGFLSSAEHCLLDGMNKAGRIKPVVSPISFVYRPRLGGLKAELARTSMRCRMTLI